MMPEAGLEPASGMNHTTSVGSSDNVFITPQGNPYVPFCRSWKDSDVRLIELRNIDRSFWSNGGKSSSYLRQYITPSRAFNFSPRLIVKSKFNSNSDQLVFDLRLRQLVRDLQKHSFIRRVDAAIDLLTDVD